MRTTRAVLETLGERVQEGEATDIASPLPMEIDRYLLAAEHGQSYDYDEFVDRVVDRLNYDDLALDSSYGAPSPVDEGEAVYRIKAVTELLDEQLPGSEIADVEAQLSDDFDDVFEFIGAETKPWEAA